MLSGEERKQKLRRQDSPSAQNFMYRLYQYIFTQGVGCTLNHSANSTFITTYSYIIIVCMCCVYDVRIALMSLDCVRNIPLFVVSAVDFNAKLPHNNTIQSAIRWVIHTHKNHTLDTHTRTHKRHPLQTTALYLSSPNKCEQMVKVVIIVMW